jgi:hypothetical protein
MAVRITLPLEVYFSFSFLSLKSINQRFRRCFPLSFSSRELGSNVIYVAMIYLKLRVVLTENSYRTTSWDTSRMVSLDDLSLCRVESVMLRKGPWRSRTVIMGAKFRPSVLQSPTTIISFPSLNRKGTLTPEREPVTYSIVFIVDSRSFLLELASVMLTKLGRHFIKCRVFIALYRTSCSIINDQKSSAASPFLLDLNPT